MVTTLKIRLTVYPLELDAYLDKLARSSDPYLQAKLKKHVAQLLSGSRPPFEYLLPVKQLVDLARVYGEQFVADPWSDIEQYFDVLTRRLYSRPIPTQRAILFLFGTGKPYQPNLGTLSAAGEAVAGYCLEQFGYNALVRPIGIMPDVLMCTKRDNELRLAFCEAKASVSISKSPQKMILDNAYKFMLDIKTRTGAFSRNHYEAYLTCSVFKDGGKVEAACLYLDLGAYRKVGGEELPLDCQKVEPSDDPRTRLRAILRMQAGTVRARDEYLAGLLSEEATRTATVAMLRENKPPKGLADVDEYILGQARETGFEQEWKESQEVIRDTKGREAESLRAALRRYRNPDLDME